MKVLVALLALLAVALVYLVAGPIPGVRPARRKPLGSYEKAIAEVRAEVSRDTAVLSPECGSMK